MAGLVSGAEMVEIGHDRLSLTLVPQIGGAIAAFRRRMEDGRVVDLLRPMDAASIARGDVLGAACFPLTPFSNRLKAGHFRFGPHDIAMPLNSDGSHVEHGHGWQRPWELVTHSAETATLVYRHQPDAWPFAYEMRQTFALLADHLSVTMETVNLAAEPMPYGFGLHPYFARTADCELRAKVSGFWEVDAEIMPTKLVAVPPRSDPNRTIRIADHELDNAFTD
ncbi:MAG: hypothetical protein ABWY00_16280, partial [Dongiaceae bacterium]